MAKLECFGRWNTYLVIAASPFPFLQISLSTPLGTAKRKTRESLSIGIACKRHIREEDPIVARNQRICTYSHIFLFQVSEDTHAIDAGVSVRTYSPGGNKQTVNWSREQLEITLCLNAEC